MRTTPIFKGATRPACILGIPIKPFVAVSGVFCLSAFWFAMPIVLGLPVALFVMRRITEDDDQAFGQWAINLRTRMAAHRMKAAQGSVSVFAATSYKVRQEIK